MQLVCVVNSCGWCRGFPLCLSGLLECLHPSLFWWPALQLPILKNCSIFPSNTTAAKIYQCYAPSAIDTLRYVCKQCMYIKAKLQPPGLLQTFRFLFYGKDLPFYFHFVKIFAVDWFICFLSPIYLLLCTLAAICIPLRLAKESDQIECIGTLHCKVSLEISYR